MEKNIGGIDKTLRIILGIVLLFAGLFASFSGAGRVLVLVLSVGTLFSGIFCF